MIASEIMTRKVFTTTPQTCVREVAQLMSRERISGVPVIDSGGQLIGMITEADIIGHIERETSRLPADSQPIDQEHVYVADIMSRRLITVSADTFVSEIAALLVEHTIKRVPVVQDGRVIGIISRGDIVQAVAQGHLVIRQW